MSIGGSLSMSNTYDFKYSKYCKVKYGAEKWMFDFSILFPDIYRVSSSLGTTYNPLLLFLTLAMVTGMF